MPKAIKKPKFKAVFTKTVRDILSKVTAQDSEENLAGPSCIATAAYLNNCQNEMISSANKSPGESQKNNRNTPKQLNLKVITPKHDKNTENTAAAGSVIITKNLQNDLKEHETFSTCQVENISTEQSNTEEAGKKTAECATELDECQKIYANKALKTNLTVINPTPDQKIEGAIATKSVRTPKDLEDDFKEHDKSITCQVENISLEQCNTEKTEEKTEEKTTECTVGCEYLPEEPNAENEFLLCNTSVISPVLNKKSNNAEANVHIECDVSQLDNETLEVSSLKNIESSTTETIGLKEQEIGQTVLQKCAVNKNDSSTDCSRTDEMQNQQEKHTKEITLLDNQIDDVEMQTHSQIEIECNSKASDIKADKVDENTAKCSIFDEQLSDQKKLNSDKSSSPSDSSHTEEIKIFQKTYTLVKKEVTPSEDLENGTNNQNGNPVKISVLETLPIISDKYENDSNMYPAIDIQQKLEENPANDKNKSQQNKHATLENESSLPEDKKYDIEAQRNSLHENLAFVIKSEIENHATKCPVIMNQVKDQETLKQIVMDETHNIPTDSLELDETDTQQSKHTTFTHEVAKSAELVEDINQQKAILAEKEMLEALIKKRLSRKRNRTFSDNTDEKNVLIPAKRIRTDFKRNRQKYRKNKNILFYNFKISSWNVNGIHLWSQNGGLEYLEKEKPDIFCMQEINCTFGRIPDIVKYISGFHQYWLCVPDGSSGVALYTQQMPMNVDYDFENSEFSGHVITAEFEKFFVICVDAPSSGINLVKLNCRLKWDCLFHLHVQNLNKRKPVIICGNMNVSHKEIDISRPKYYKQSPGFSKEEQEKLSELLTSGFVDTFRYFNPNRKGAFTYWTRRHKSQEHTVGWRLDYCIVSERFLPKIVNSLIQEKYLESNHCPIVVLFKF